VSIIEKALERLDQGLEASESRTKSGGANPDAGDVPIPASESVLVKTDTANATEGLNSSNSSSVRPFVAESSPPVPGPTEIDQADQFIKAPDPEPEIPQLDFDGISSATEAHVPEIDLANVNAMALPVDESVDVSGAAEFRRVSAEVAVDLANLERLGLLSPNIGNSPLAEQMRVIKRPLLLQAEAREVEGGANSNLIMVASALPNEGKTSTAVNLAVSIAMERDRTVLLVDADVAKSDVSKILGVDAEFGLTDLLDDPELTIPDVMLRTDIPKLSMIPAGNRHPNLTELFAGDDMRRLMRDLSTRYPDRIIVIDSPPLLATSGASVLGSLVGQIVMVVEAIRTPQSAVAEALKMLGPLDNIGIVLNKARERPSFAYGYGYGYDYYVKQPSR
jgi:protein-tyrosine kinase